MGNAKSLSGQKMGSRFLPEEQAEVDKLFDALSSSDGGVATGTFSLEALKSHVKEALPPAMVARLYNGMWRVKPTDRAHGSCRSVSREQFTVFLSHLLKGSCEEKGLMVMKMISVAEGPTKTRDVQKFTEDLVASVVHVLTHRHELRGWTWRKSTVPHDSMQAMVAQLLSEMKFQGKCGAAILCPVIQTLACWSASVVTTQTSQGGSAVACACLPCSAIAVGYPRVLQLCRSHCVIRLPPLVSVSEILGQFYRNGLSIFVDF